MSAPKKNLDRFFEVLAPGARIESTAKTYKIIQEGYAKITLSNSDREKSRKHWERSSHTSNTQLEDNGSQTENIWTKN